MSAPEDSGSINSDRSLVPTECVLPSEAFDSPVLETSQTSEYILFYTDIEIDLRVSAFGG